MSVLVRTLLLLSTLVLVDACIVDDILEHNLKTQWMKTMVNTCQHSSFLLAKPFLQLSQNRSDVYSGSSFQCSPSSGCSPLDDPSCTTCMPAVQVEVSPERPSTDLRDDIRLRSVCPWTYMETTNRMMRYPSVMVEAVCLCEASGSCPCFKASPSESSCEPVDVPVPVLVNTREADTEGRCVFEPKMYRLKVGCTCANKPKVH